MHIVSSTRGVGSQIPVRWGEDFGQIYTQDGEYSSILMMTVSHLRYHKLSSLSIGFPVFLIPSAYSRLFQFEMSDGDQVDVMMEQLGGQIWATRVVS
ncbi:hypothetical protein BC937DRAFT_88148 [Endogone sp. FLAS-F59071]|nr:hypothetical protein BC937DRAFT_88148 [Endogone sp. FLAS-F59071]|eukprot:RUS18946.1 hypothetical protein BC937DRAFT_88148 [Endogone sp. FLAS-F59071]